MTSVDICQYNFKMWLQDKCSSHAGSIVNNFISGAIHAEYIPEKRTFVIYPDKKEYRNLVRGYVENDEGKMEYTNESLKQYPAAGAFISTVEDLRIWNQYFFGGKLLKEGSFRLMTTKQDKAIRNHPIFGITKYGYGITIDDRDRIIQWGQTGYAPGFVSMNYYFPQSKTSVIVLENVNYDISDLKKTFYYHVQILDLVRNEVLKEVAQSNKK